MAYFLSQLPFYSILQVLDSSYFGFPEWKSLYSIDSDYAATISQLSDPLMAKEDSLGDFHLKDGLLYKLGLLCIPSDSYRP